ncbi:MAG: flagellar biosynthesis anti-sigma factor FlgM [Zoogloea sp.]|nr:flagellar biosynthesis anti-sigma factor FlgM [Zoogloea sp.]
MKIDNSMKTVAGLSSSEIRARSAKEDSAAAARGEGDTVQLSSLSGHLQQMGQAMSNAPVVDRAKVDEIKQAISSGQFKVDAGKVADGLIKSVRDMLSAQQA